MMTLIDPMRGQSPDVIAKRYVKAVTSNTNDPIYGSPEEMLETMIVVFGKTVVEAYTSHFFLKHVERTTQTWQYPRD